MKYFGTDGIRQKSDFFTDGFLRKAAFAAVKTAVIPKFFIGRDTRVSGERIERALAGHIASFGGEVIVGGVLPSPAAAYLARLNKCGYGIAVSASHNPPEYNGIKFFGPDGGKLSENEENAIEIEIDRAISGSGERGAGSSEDNINIDPYLSSLLSPLRSLEHPSPLPLRGLRLIADAGDGAASSFIKPLFESAGAEVAVINGEGDGSKINVSSGATHPETLLKAMEGGDHGLGFTFDGDADRVLAIKGGKIFSGDQIIYAAARYFKEKGLMKTPIVVGTVMTNLGIENALKKSGINLLRAKVGDKYVLDLMREKGAAIGGEASGHVIFLDYANTGDGLLTALIAAKIEKEVGLDSYFVEEYPQAERDILTSPENILKFKGSESIKAFLSSFKFDGRIVVRPSGTEPKIRIMAEAESEEGAKAAAEEIRKFIICNL
jgi:Phosphomannomutase